MSQAIIDVRNLSLSFSRKKVLAGLNFSLNRGEWAVIAGRNGAGKSTLLRALSGVLLPDEGTIRHGPGARPEKIGFISDRLSLFEDWTIDQASDFHCRAFHIGDFDGQLVKRLGVRGRDRIKNLSAGERAILHLSLVLAQKPSLLLVDEVLHMLDPYIRDLFIEALIEAMAVQQAAVLTVNHTFGEIERLPERVLVMDEGRFIVDETVEALRGKMRKVVSRDPLPETQPCIFKKTEGEYKEYFIFPFQEELRQGNALDFQEMALPEIIKAFIGGGYEQKRMA
ncbi:MAG: ABC transporter ATP-binding protein [Acidobacteriota bacterium]|nr:ABC transporter ATP-binding protein [Acidobacteriota bacterium]